MGYYHSSYFAYGALVAKPADVDYDLIEFMDIEGEEANDIMKKYGLGHLLAGNYDRDMLFIVTKCHSVDLGKYEMINQQRMKDFDYVNNYTRVMEGIRELGLEVIDGPGWILIPDMS
jgi:hypothetical protein